VDRVAVGLGSNLGDRRAHLDFAVSRLRTLLTNPVISSYYETVPVDAGGPQPMFLNAAAVGGAVIGAQQLLAALLEIEHERGRQRTGINAARTLDCDLILYGGSIIEKPGLLVPHPRFRERRFVLEPLADIAPDLVDPVTGLTVRELLERLAPSE
jgi:2-amino-4-hydroxy-6-hydroxymethyldihydropteridine diphosphokinase